MGVKFSYLVSGPRTGRFAGCCQFHRAPSLSPRSLNQERPARALPIFTRGGGSGPTRMSTFCSDPVSHWIFFFFFLVRVGQPKKKIQKQQNQKPKNKQQKKKVSYCPGKEEDKNKNKAEQNRSLSSKGGGLEGQDHLFWPYCSNWSVTGFREPVPLAFTNISMSTSALTACTLFLTISADLGGIWMIIKKSKKKERKKRKKECVRRQQGRKERKKKKKL